MELIDRECLRNCMYHKCIETDEEIDKGRAKWESGLWIRYKVFEETLDEQITVIPESRPNGVWVGIDEEPHEEWECSNCGNIVNPYMQDELKEYKYCHKCGAEMSTPWAEMENEECQQEK